MVKPEKVFKMGAVRASIFRNVIEREGRSIDIPKIVLEVRYRDKSGQWKGSNSFSTNEVPKAIMALQKAYEYLLGEGATRQTDAAAEAAAPHRNSGHRARLFKASSPPRCGGETMKRGRKPMCPYCRSSRTISKGVRRTTTFGNRPLRVCNDCKRKFTAIKRHEPNGLRDLNPEM